MKRNISQKLILLPFITLPAVNRTTFTCIVKDIEIHTQGCLISNDSASLDARIFSKTIFTFG